ncbi:ESC2 [Candida pseudojiufengensis]|uniref:ESC2 n=1 Tax=Candida pseudojiufengensis TaxID=497109 RepID=UPI002225A3E7|nr:ESC2 [Candida pseudojiufengensis]KAI5963760.1 ESC2 [Candida pseudojiufengensis]
MNNKESTDTSFTETNNSKSNKRKGLLEDDFFSLSGGPLGSRKKKKTKTKLSPKSSSPTSNNPDLSIHIQTEEPVAVKTESFTETKLITPKSSFTETKDSETTIKTNSPTVLDKEKMRREIESQINLKRDPKQASAPVLDDSDDSDDDLIPRNKRSPSIPSASPSTNTNESSTEYKFTEANEKKRKYIIRVTTKLPVPENVTAQVDLGCKGLKSFAKILESSVEFFKKTYEKSLPQVYLDRYNKEYSSLVWLEGKTLIHSFYSPKTLRIPPPGGQFNSLVDKIETLSPTLVSVLLIPRTNSENFMHVFPEFSKEPEVEEPPSVDIIEKEDIEESSSEDEADPNIMPDEPSNAEAIEVEDGVFSVGLKGKDNKKISCKVTPDTKLKNLLAFYIQKKGLVVSEDKIQNARLIFDDEEMNLNETVGDTELEDDFEIQVII